MLNISVHHTDWPSMSSFVLVCNKYDCNSNTSELEVKATINRLFTVQLSRAEVIYS